MELAAGAGNLCGELYVQVYNGDSVDTFDLFPGGKSGEVFGKGDHRADEESGDGAGSSLTRSFGKGDYRANEESGDGAGSGLAGSFGKGDHRANEESGNGAGSGLTGSFKMRFGLFGKGNVSLLKSPNVFLRVFCFYQRSHYFINRQMYRCSRKILPINPAGSFYVCHPFRYYKVKRPGEQGGYEWREGGNQVVN